MHLFSTEHEKTVSILLSVRITTLFSDIRQLYRICKTQYLDEVQKLNNRSQHTIHWQNS